MTTLPSEYEDLFEKRTIAHLTTLLPDGRPHPTAVWIDRNETGTRVLVNTEAGRQKHVNVQRDPRVGLSMTDPDDPYRALSIVGEVDRLTEDDAGTHMNTLTKRYRGTEADERTRTGRIILEIRPDRVVTR